jgi:allophanate hydrolase
MVVLPGAIARPGVMPSDGGGAIYGEIWSLPSAALAAFLATIAPPLGLGTVRLQGGETCIGFICEAIATEGLQDITELGDWRAFQPGA